jgi:hypothetical protein
MKKMHKIKPSGRNSVFHIEWEEDGMHVFMLPEKEYPCRCTSESMRAFVKA